MARPKRRKRRSLPRGFIKRYPELWGLGLVALGAFLGSVKYAGWNGGWVGRELVNGFDALIGGASWVLPVLLVTLGVLMVARSALVDVRPFRAGLVVLAFGLMIALGRDQGGYLGQALGGAVGVAIGVTGSTILGAFLLLVGALLLSGASLGAILRHSHRRVREVARRRPSPAPAAVPRPKKSQPLVDAEEAFPDVVAEIAPSPLISLEPQPLVVHQEQLFEDITTEHPEYRLPDRTVLRRSPEKGSTTEEASARVAELLVQTLAHFGVDATVMGQISGPRVTRFELQLAPGTKVSKVAGLKDDLSYALATTEIRILAPIPGKQAVGVELPNLSPNLVTLGDIFDDLPATASPLSVWLGKDISGAAVWTDLARMPHLLIAGTTGSGKSGCINALLCSILLRATPDEVRMILVDPKRVELNHYESIPHLLTPVVTNMKNAALVLQNIVREMESRYELMGAVKARNLAEWNRKRQGLGQDTVPHILVVIDELADLMMVSPADVEDAIIRLAQKSRAVGIHLVLATQSPRVDVITGMIKANVPSRIAFAVSSQTDSRVILDVNGAEALLGAGDMLYKPLGTSKMLRVQGAYISEDETRRIVEACRKQGEPTFEEELLELPADIEPEQLDADEDPVLNDAIRLVAQHQTASVSLLQRRLRVGYTRAGRLIDMLERRGIVSGYEGSKARNVLISETDLARILGEDQPQPIDAPVEDFTF